MVGKSMDVHMYVLVCSYDIGLEEVDKGAQGCTRGYA